MRLALFGRQSLALKLLPIALLVCTVPAIGQEKQPRIKIGEKAPEFTLEDQSGKEASLRKLLSQRPVALVFFRSANW